MQGDVDVVPVDPVVGDYVCALVSACARTVCALSGSPFVGAAALRRSRRGDLLRVLNGVGNSSAPSSSHCSVLRLHSDSAGRSLPLAH
eukprot:466336-Pyramimonas_sp.AAC.1